MAGGRGGAAGWGARRQDCGPLRQPGVRRGRLGRLVAAAAIGAGVGVARERDRTERDMFTELVGPLDREVGTELGVWHRGAGHVNVHADIHCDASP